MWELHRDDLVLVAAVGHLARTGQVQQGEVTRGQGGLPVALGEHRAAPHLHVDLEQLRVGVADEPGRAEHPQRGAAHLGDLDHPDPPGEDLGPEVAIGVHPHTERDDGVGNHVAK